MTRRALSVRNGMGAAYALNAALMPLTFPHVLIWLQLLQDEALHALFERAWDVYEDANDQQAEVSFVSMLLKVITHAFGSISTCHGVIRDAQAFCCAQDAIRWLQAAVAKASVVGIFSSNEDIDDIATADLKYLLLPYMQGYLLSETHERDTPERLASLEEAGHHIVRYVPLHKV